MRTAISAASEVEEPIKDLFPFVGFVFFQAAKEAREVIEDEEFDQFFDAYFGDDPLSLWISEVHNESGFIEEVFVVEGE